jgi:hypothetical protein
MISTFERTRPFPHQAYCNLRVHTDRAAHCLQPSAQSSSQGSADYVSTLSNIRACNTRSQFQPSGDHRLPLVSSCEQPTTANCNLRGVRSLDKQTPDPIHGPNFNLSGTRNPSFAFQSQSACSYRRSNLRGRQLPREQKGATIALFQP